MKLYVRPMLLGSGQQLGLCPPSEVSLLFYVSPTVSTLHNLFDFSRGDVAISIAKFVIVKNWESVMEILLNSMLDTFFNSLICFREITSKAPPAASIFIWKPNDAVPHEVVLET